MRTNAQLAAAAFHRPKNAVRCKVAVSLSLLSFRWFALAMAASLVLWATVSQAQPAAGNTPHHSANPTAPIWMDQLGALAQKQYQGDGLSLSATPDGARLHCALQHLEGFVSRDGLWLTSTAEDNGRDRFQIMAVAVGRQEDPLSQDDSPPSPSIRHTTRCGRPLRSPETNLTADTRWLSQIDESLPQDGHVVVADKVARFIRPCVTEEYSVSVDGIRQDFVIAQPPLGVGHLRLELALHGARAESTVYGARLTLEESGRTLAYSQMRVLDATGQELVARLDVLSADRLAVQVEDTCAAYPVRIDPTFSDVDWVSLNPSVPGADGIAHALAVDNSGNLYVGGEFSVIGTVAANYIAKWDGNAWLALGSGMNDWVYALAVNGTNLYAGGWFTTAGGLPANYIAKWDGSSWSPLGSGLNNTVYALAASDTNLYAGGAFTAAGGGTAKYIARWNGSAWSALGSGMNNSVYALAVSGNDLYAGGYFATAGGVAAKNIARWNGSTWSPLGSGMGDNTSGMGGSVLALVMHGTSLYAGGGFMTAGGVAATFIAKWKNGSIWLALGSGMNYPVTALAVSGTNVYVGGMFTTAGKVTANAIAKWDGSTWAALGSGINGPVSALAVSGTNLYAGGTFTVAGGVAATNIAKWDGNAWSALGSGMNNSVYALAVSGSDLYAGGDFTTAGRLTVNCIAKWNGNTWSALGKGMSVDDLDDAPSVAALAASGDGLYAAGWFSSAGGVVANNIAKWDGSTWSALGQGILDPVAALAVSGTDLYAGGKFTTAGGVEANCIAKWDGNAWSPLGAGITYEIDYGGYFGNGVLALAVEESGGLFVGGYFTLAGTNVSPFIAMANLRAGVAGGRFDSITYSPATGFRGIFCHATPGRPYRIQTSTSPTAGTWTDYTNFTYNGPVVITDTSSLTTTNRLYRAVTP